MFKKFFILTLIINFNYLFCVNCFAENKYEELYIEPNKEIVVEENNKSDENKTKIKDSLNGFLQELDGVDNKIIEANMIKNQSKDRFTEFVKIRILNKITGKTFEIEKKIGQNVEVENLKIELIRCWKSYAEETPENKLLLKVFENTEKYSEKNNLIFYGWIFSSSPSLNGLEHKFYDITLENCKNIEIIKE